MVTHMDIECGSCSPLQMPYVYSYSACFTQALLKLFRQPLGCFSVCCQSSCKQTCDVNLMGRIGMYYCVSPRGAHNVTSSVHYFNTAKNVFSITCRTVLPVAYTTYTLHECQTWREYAAAPPRLAHTMQLACMQSPMSCSQPNKTNEENGNIKQSSFAIFIEPTINSQSAMPLPPRDMCPSNTITLSPQATEKQHINVHWSASQAMQISHEKGEKNLACTNAFLLISQGKTPLHS